MRQTNSIITQFIQTVCKQVRRKRLHDSIENELAGHIETQKTAYLEQGMEEAEAIQRAVASMGDPVEVGKQLNQAHKPVVEWSVVGVTAAIAIIGLTVQFAMGHSTERYAMFAGIGVGILALAYFLECRILSKWTWPIVGGIVALAVLPYFLPEGTSIASPFYYIGRINGQYKYIGFISLLFCPVMTLSINKLREKRWLGYAGCWAIYIILSLICLHGPSLFGWGLLTGTFFLVLITAIAKDWFPLNKPVALAATVLPFATLAAALFLWMPDRLLYILRPDFFPSGSGYITMMCRQMIEGANLFGANPTMPEMGGVWSMDYLLATVIGQFGYAAGFGIVAAFSALVWRLAVATRRHKTALGFLLSLCSTVTIASQGILYILSNLGFYLPHGTMPLLSYGGAGYVANMMLIGLSLAAYRRVRQHEPNAARATA